MLDVTHIFQTDARYPESLREYLGDDAPAVLNAVGNVELLQTRSLGLFCSRRCPGSLILQTYDLAQELRAAGSAVIGGFHSPVERECLNVLLRGSNPIIICLARGFERMRMSKAYAKPFNQERILLLSPFPDKTARADKTTTFKRNTLVAALADRVFVAHAEPGSKTEMLCRDIVGWRKPIYVLDDRRNLNLLGIGAKPATARSLHFAPSR